MVAAARQWRIRAANDPAPYYGWIPRGRRFTLKRHHNGKFIRTVTKEYEWQGLVGYVDIRIFSVCELDDMVRLLGHTSVGYFDAFWGIPSLSLRFGTYHIGYFDEMDMKMLKLHLQGIISMKKLSFYVDRNINSTFTQEFLFGRRLMPGESRFFSDEDTSSSCSFDYDPEDAKYMSDARS